MRNGSYLSVSYPRTEELATTDHVQFLEVDRYGVKLPGWGETVCVPIPTAHLLEGRAAVKGLNLDL